MVNVQYLKLQCVFEVTSRGMWQGSNMPPKVLHVQDLPTLTVQHPSHTGAQGLVTHPV